MFTAHPYAHDQTAEHRPTIIIACRPACAPSYALFKRFRVDGYVSILLFPVNGYTFSYAKTLINSRHLLITFAGKNYDTSIELR
jgi:hypothetical protein